VLVKKQTPAAGEDLKSSAKSLQSKYFREMLDLNGLINRWMFWAVLLGTGYTCEDYILVLCFIIFTPFSSLKNRYHLHQKSLKATGHGLIMEGREDEIGEGSVIENVWGTSLPIL
jgi:hypothetical protein